MIFKKKTINENLFKLAKNWDFDDIRVDQRKSKLEIS